MKECEKEEIIRYLIDKTPIILDIENNDLRYDKKDIHYKIYKYIKELQEEIKNLKKR